jgi:putative transposase
MERRDWMIKKFKEAAVFDQLQVWQTSDHPVRIDLKKRNSLQECLQHIHNNPLRNKIVTASQDYLHSSARNYLGSNGLVKVQLPVLKSEMGRMLHNIPSYTYSYQKTYE